MEHETRADRWAHWMFVATMLGKGLLGVVQLITAAALALGVMQYLPAMVLRLAQTELAEDPRDFFGSKLLSLAQALPGEDWTFYTIYFAVHGVLHLGVVWALLLGHLKAYPAAIAVLAAFIVYQMVEFFIAGGVMLIVLSALDLLVIYLTLREWRVRDPRRR